jgi:hypothetical protein
MFSYPVDVAIPVSLPFALGVDPSAEVLRLAAPIGTRGGAVQVDPIKPALKVPGTKRVELIYDGPLSNFTFNFNLRRYTAADARLARLRRWAQIFGRPRWGAAR